MAEMVALNESPSPFRLYLTHIDVVLRYVWVGLCLGFPYSIDAARLKDAIRDLLRVYPSLAGRYRL